jgi:hypothetical protein
MGLTYSTAEGGAPDEPARRQEPRRHPRTTVFKAATIYPVLRDAGFPIANVSQFGVMGRCALPLSLSQCVHLTFDDREYVPAEVRWAQGDRYGLQFAEPRVDLPGIPQDELVRDPAADGLRPRAPRFPVDLPATLITTLPMMPGLVRNISRGGMLIEVRTRLREGGRLLVKMRDQPTFIGRIQWSKLGCAGLEFAHELSGEIRADGERPAEAVAGDRAGPRDIEVG